MQRNDSQGILDRSGTPALQEVGLAARSSLETGAEVLVPIVSDTDIVKVRCKAWELGLSLGFSHGKIVEVVAATVELARKIYQSRLPGVITLTTVASSRGLIVTAQSDGLDAPDNGPELIRVLKLMDEFSVTHDEHKCMAVTATKWVSGRAHHSDHNGS